MSLKLISGARGRGREMEERLQRELLVSERLDGVDRGKGRRAGGGKGTEE